MKGLLQVRAAVVQTLTDAGLSAVAAFSGAAPAVTAPVIAVEAAGAEGTPAAFGSYLGEVYDDAAGTVSERYGLRMEVTLRLNVYAPAAAECESAMERACDALTGALPSGLRLKKQSWGAAEWDRSARCFRRQGTLSCTASFTAERGGEDGTFLDFTLKGVLNS